MENKPLDTLYPGGDAEHQESSLPDTDFFLGKKPGYPKRQFVSPITGPQFTPSSTLSACEQITAIQATSTTQELEQDNLSAQQTVIVPIVIEKKVTDSGVVEQIQPIQMVSVSQTVEVEDDEAVILQTVAISTVEKKRAKKKISTFFYNVMIMLLSALVLSFIVAIIIALSSPLYKAAVFLVFLIVLSYVVSLQVKLFYRARQQEFLTVTQMVQVVGKRPKSSRDKDMKHLTLIKQDTTTFLRAITKKDIKKDSR